MKSLTATIPIGLGDLIYIKAMLDNVKAQYSQIKLKLHREIVGFYEIHPDYNKFLDDISNLFFSQPPYVITQESGIPFYGIVSLCHDNGITPIKPNLAHLLCKGTPLSLDEEYIVITTKVRYLPRTYLDEKVVSFWKTMNLLAKKYRIVILGERAVEFHHGYVEIGPNNVYSIYNSIIDNMPADRLVDLTVPALGQTSPQLSKIQQDCLIMNQAKFVVTLGIGGGFCMATAVGNTIGYRNDTDSIADEVFRHSYPNTHITKDWNTFIRALEDKL